MIDWINQIMQRMGYSGIFVLMFLDNIFPPIPSELIMPAAGFICSQGTLNIFAVVLAGSLGSISAAVILYGLGRFLNENRLISWLKQYGKWIFIKPQDILNAKQAFNRHGNKIVFFGRMIPALRSIISIPAGMAGMPFKQFLWYSSLGTLIWTSLLAGAGYFLAENYQTFTDWISTAGAAVTVSLLLLMVAGLYIYFKKKKQDLAIR